jgi:hypothetical protein
MLVPTLTGSVYGSEVRNLELFPVGDSFIYKDNPTSNYGKELYLYTEYGNQKTIIYGSSFSVGPFNSHSISVSLPHNGKISGSFSVTGGSGNDIDFRIEGLTTYYSESRVTSLAFSFEAPYSGSFDLVFDNSFSWLSSKTVSLSDVTLSMDPFGVICSPIFLLFDLSSIPPQATIDTTRLTLSLWSQWESSQCIVAAFQC